MGPNLDIASPELNDSKLSTEEIRFIFFCFENGYDYNSCDSTMHNKNFQPAICINATSFIFFSSLQYVFDDVLQRVEHLLSVSWQRVPCSRYIAACDSDDEFSGLGAVHADAYRTVTNALYSPQGVVQQNASYVLGELSIRRGVLGDRFRNVVGRISQEIEADSCYVTE